MKATLAARCVVPAALILACTDRPTTAVDRPAGITDAAPPTAHRGFDDDDDGDRGTARGFPVRGVLSNGRTFTGTITVRELVPQRRLSNGAVEGVARGTLVGRVGRTDGKRGRIEQTFETNVTVTPTHAGVLGALRVIPAQAQQACPVLAISFGVIDVVALGGLRLRLDLIAIDLTASGLLGGLLCGLLGPLQA